MSLFSYPCDITTVTHPGTVISSLHLLLHTGVSDPAFVRRVIRMANTSKESDRTIEERG